MFFLGHITWAYVWAAIFNGKRFGKIFIPAILILGVMADIDLFLRRYGVEHHTFTHSLFFWVLLLTPFIAVYGRGTIPYFIATIQHFTFGDFIAGKVMLFWPFSSSYYGFKINMISALNIALETAGLLLAAAILYSNGDLKRLLSIDKRNIPMAIPLLALVTSILFFAVDIPIIPLITHIWESPLFGTLVITHLLLIIFLATSTIQGLRGLQFRT